MARKSNLKGTPRQFKYSDPQATKVLLAADFTDWAEHAVAMKRGASGDWNATVTIPPGRHEYRFIVDGRWTDDPGCPERALNPFGTTNSVCVAG